MRSKSIAIAFLFVCIALLLSLGTWKTGAVAAAKAPHVTSDDRNDDGNEIALLDDCDPRDPTWAPTGGCKLAKGDVTRAEFNAFLNSPLSLSVVGHQAWTIEPTYLKAQPNATVKVTNRGGRGHTFTEVTNFGGGRVPPLNQGLLPAKECATSSDVAPGASIAVNGLSVGNHRFQCCIHPWMRAVIKVKPQGDDDHEGDHDHR